MTEYSIPLKELEAQFEPTLNGHEDDTPHPHVDAQRGVFITSRGTEIELSSQPVSALIVERLQAEGKPKIPMIEVTLLGKHKQLEPFPQHEGYKALLAEWEAEGQLKLMRYLFIVGTKGTPPQDFIDAQSPFFPNATEMEMKYLWVASRLPDEDMGEFVEAVMGRTLPTTKGLEESANSFRSED